jgi:hypothetical protein
MLKKLVDIMFFAKQIIKTPPVYTAEKKINHVNRGRIGAGIAGPPGNSKNLQLLSYQV